MTAHATMARRVPTEKAGPQEISDAAKAPAGSWATCPGCQLRHTRRADAVCPRCSRPVGSVAGPAAPASTPFTEATRDTRTDWEKPGTWFTLAGGLVLGILGIVVIGPWFFPRTGREINFAQALCAGACGGVGAWIGQLLGVWADKSKA